MGWSPCPVPHGAAKVFLAHLGCSDGYRHDDIDDDIQDLRDNRHQSHDHDPDHPYLQSSSRL